jgi:hypothetical protein
MEMNMNIILELTTHILLFYRYHIIKLVVIKLMHKLEKLVQTTQTMVCSTDI